MNLLGALMELMERFLMFFWASEFNWNFKRKVMKGFFPLGFFINILIIALFI